MHYLFVNGRFPQYSQTFVHDQIKAIKGQGARVSVFARSRAPFRFEESVSECADGLLYAKPFDFRMVRRIFLGVLRHPFRAAQLLRLRLQKKIHKQTMWLGMQLNKAPDVAITHFGNNYPVGVQLKRFVFPSMKNIVVFHGHDVSSYVKKNGWKDYRNAALHIDCAVCVNRIWAEQLRENTEIADIRTIYLGTSIHALPRARNGDQSIFSILFVGRYVEKKGFGRLYAAIRNIAGAKGMAVRVHCVGDGPQLSEFKQKAVRDGIGDNFVFYGAKQKSFVRQLMSECDLLVAPSQTAQDGDSEGLPVVLMEAMVAGIPIVSTYHSGIPELITDQVSGLLVPERDVDALFHAIEFAMANPEKMTEMAANAREHVVKAHDEKVQVQAFVDAVGAIQ